MSKSIYLNKVSLEICKGYDCLFLKDSKGYDFFLTEEKFVSSNAHIIKMNSKCFQKLAFTPKAVFMATALCLWECYYLLKERKKALLKKVSK